MLEAAKCCYKDFESQFSRIFKIAAGFQFYLHFPRGLQSAEGWPAEKISKLNWNVFGEKKKGNTNLHQEAKLNCILSFLKKCQKKTMKLGWR